MPKIPGRMRKGKYNLLNRRKSKMPFVERKPDEQTGRYDRRQFPFRFKETKLIQKGSSGKEEVVKTYHSDLDEKKSIPEGRGVNGKIKDIKWSGEKTRSKGIKSVIGGKEQEIYLKSQVHFLKTDRRKTFVKTDRRKPKRKKVI